MIKKISFLIFIQVLVSFVPCIYAQQSTKELIVNWLEDEQDNDWGTWNQVYDVIPYYRSQSTVVSVAIDAQATSLTGSNFATFPATGKVYVGSTVQNAEVMSYSKVDSQHLSVVRAQDGTTAVAHIAGEIIVEVPSEINCNSNISQFATLVTARALLNLYPAGNNEGFKKALVWIETQEFNNTEYLARQIEILAKSGRNCDLLLEKLLSWKNTDGGWGETTGYLTNPIDTIWALRALLSAGYRNDPEVKNILSIILASSNKFPYFNWDANKWHRWGTFHPIGYYIDPYYYWIPRQTSSIITSYIYDLLMEYADYLDDLFPIEYNQSYDDFTDFSGSRPSISSSTVITSDCQAFLISILSNYLNNAEHIQELSIVASLLKRHLVNNPTIDSAINFLANLCSQGNEGNYKSDPYLSSLILDCICESERTPIQITALSLSDKKLVANLSSSVWSSAKFYFKNNENDRFILYDIETNTSQLTTITSEKIPYSLEDGDKLAVWIDNYIWEEYEYNSSTSSYDLAVYNKDLRICDNDGNSIQNNTLIKSSSVQHLVLKQKIYNISDKFLSNVGITIQSSCNTPISDNVTLKPYEIYLYSNTFDIPANISGTVGINFSINGSDSNGANNIASTSVYIVDPASNGTNSGLEEPGNLRFELIGNNMIMLYWDAPLDPNVIAYQAGTYDDSTQTVSFFDTTLQNSIKYPLKEVPVVFRVYSLDRYSKRSIEYASLTIDPDNGSFENKDETSPYVQIAYPTENQLISTVKESSNDSYETFTVFGTVRDDMFKNYKVELIRNDEYVISGNIINDTLPVENNLLATFDLENTALSSGSYTLKVTAYDLADNSPGTESIPINIYKWGKVFVYKGNNCSSPSWNSDATELIFSSNRYNAEESNDGFVENLWKWNGSNNSISQITYLFSNAMEPVWYENGNVLFTAYKNGTRNLVTKNMTTGAETTLSVEIDAGGNQVKSPPVILGDNTLGSLGDNVEKNTLCAFGPYECQKTNNCIKEMYFYVNSVPSQTKVDMKFALYLNTIYNNEDYPGEKYVETEKLSISTIGWKKFTFVTPIPLQQGQKYWFVHINDHSSTVSIQGKKFSTSTLKLRKYSRSFSDGFPQNYGTTNVTTLTTKYSIYLVLENRYDKSFYNPDCVVVNNTKYIVSSDEFGELVLLVTQDDVDVDLYNLTLDLSEENNKTFLFAEKPKIKVEGTSAHVLFEGFTLTIPKVYYTQKPYLSSDIYYLNLAVPEKISSNNTKVGTDQGTTVQPPVELSNFHPNYFYASGPYSCPFNADAYTMQVYVTKVENSPCNVRLALYNGSQDNPSNGSKIGETNEKTLGITSQAKWENFSFINGPVKLHPNEKYWLVLLLNTDDIDNLFIPQNRSVGNFSYFYTPYSNGFPNEYPIVSTYTSRIPIYVQIQPDHTLDLTITQITKTENESETSPIWLSNAFLSSLGANIAYTTDKDSNLDGVGEWNIYFALLNNLGTQNPSISFNTPIINTTASIGNLGIEWEPHYIDYLDYQNNRLVYEELRMKDDITFEKEIWYLEIDSE